MSINAQLCMDVINAGDVSLFNLGGVTCLKSKKVGSILMPTVMDNGCPGFKLIPATNPIEVNGKYVCEKLVEADKELSNAYSTTRNSLIVIQIARCSKILDNDGTLVSCNEFKEDPKPCEVLDDDSGDSFDIMAFDPKEGPFVLKINDEKELNSQEFDEYIREQLGALYKKAQEKRQ